MARTNQRGDRLVTTNISLVAMVLHLFHHHPPTPTPYCGSQIPGAMATVTGVINLIIRCSHKQPHSRPLNHRLHLRFQSF